MTFERERERGRERGSAREREISCIADSGSVLAAEAVHNIRVSDSLLTDGGWVFAAGTGNPHSDPAVICCRARTDMHWHGGTGFLLQTNTTNATLEHCELSHFSYTAVSLGWSWNFSPQTTRSHSVTKNYIHHLGYPRRETGDAMACAHPSQHYSFEDSQSKYLSNQGRV